MFYNNKVKFEAARAFAVFLSDKLKPLQKVSEFLQPIDFRNFGSLAVGQTNVTRVSLS